MPDPFIEAAKEALDPPSKKEKSKADISAIAGPPSRLGQVEKGKKFQPPRILLYGIDGIGKSTWASEAPKPIFIQTEDGLNEITCDKFPQASTYLDVLHSLEAVAKEKHSYETVVIDSLDWLERLIWDSVCERTGVKNIEKAGGGFAKGYMFALDEWREVIRCLETCRSRGMVVILIAHSKIERFEDPENPAYDRYSPRLNKHAEALMREWVDATLFATKRLTVRKEGSGFNERGVATPVGADGGERVLKTSGGPSCIAKNRYDLPGEIPMPKGKGWETFVGLAFGKKG